jgi:type II secretory pathway component PulF
MSLPKLLPALLFVVFLITVFMSNSNVEMELNYYFLAHPIKVAFWELVTFCMSLGIILAASIDFLSQLSIIAERRRLTKADQEQKAEIERLTAELQTLQAENEELKKKPEGKPKGPQSPFRVESPLSEKA